MLPIDAKIISVDDHVIEHPQVWLDRPPAHPAGQLRRRQLPADPLAIYRRVSDIGHDRVPFGSYEAPNSTQCPKGTRSLGRAPLRRALGEALPDGTTFGFNSDEDDRTWIFVITADGIDPALTRVFLNTTLATLNRL
jgi:hypothetical protein